MATFIHGIAASENIDSSGERISIAGMDISSLEKDGVFNWEHKADQPGQVVGKILKAKKIFSDADCDDDYQLEFWKKCGVPYLYVMGELMDDYKESAKEVAGMFRYDMDRQKTNERNISNFSIEGAKIEKVGMDIVKSIARKVTITVTPCNKAAVASMVPVEKKPKRGSIDELFKTESIEIEILNKDEGFGAISGPTSPSLMASELKKDQPKLTVAPPAPSLGSTKSGKAVSPTAKIHEYKDFSEQDHRDAATIHLDMASKIGEKDFKTAQFHRNKGLLHNSAANTLMDRQKRMKAGKVSAPVPPAGAPQTTPRQAPKIHTSVQRPYALVGNIKKALDAGSAMAAPADLVGLPALSKENLAKKKEKSKWLARAEEEYKKWNKREEFEGFMSKRMPHLTKGEIRAIGQVMVLNKSITLEKALNDLAGYDKLSKQLSFGAPMEKAGGKDSIYTLILFEGCDLHDILHCSHFATDDMTGDTYEKIKEACDEYFEKGAEARELEFKEAGELGKESQRVLFLTGGDPYKDLFEKLKEVAEYKYSSFRPHISVTSNVDEFKGKASSLVISVNGQVRMKYDFKSDDKIPGGLADKKKPSDFDPKKLAEGIKVESEHTSDPKVAEEIAMDHLTEDPDYYEKLKNVEKK